MINCESISVGDAVLIQSRNGMARHVVTRVTKMHFEANQVKFRKRGGAQVGRDIWDGVFARPFDADAAKRFEEYRAEQKIKIMRARLAGLKWYSQPEEIVTTAYIALDQLKLFEVAGQK